MRKIQVNVAGVSTSVYENLLTLKPNGDYEKHYNADMSLDTVTINIEALEKLVSDGEALVEAHIQKPITAYNKAKGVKFSDAHNCETWSRDATYEHQAFCIAAWEFHKAVFVAGRALQATILASGEPYPIAEEFKAMLPKFGA